MINPITQKRIIAKAQSLGSTATTFRGAIRYILNHPKPYPTIPMPLPDLDRERRGWYPTKYLHMPTRGHYLRTLPRKADPERSRCRDDAAYRAKVLRRLSKQAHALLAMPTLPEDPRTVLPTWEGRKTDVAKLQARYLELAGKPPHWADDIPAQNPRLTVVDANTIVGSLRLLKTLGMKANMRPPSLHVYPTMGETRIDHTPHESEHVGGNRWRTKTSARADHYYHSVAIISEDSYSADIAILDRRYTLHAPGGTRWIVGSEPRSLALQSEETGRDRHVDIADVISWNNRFSSIVWEINQVDIKTLTQEQVINKLTHIWVDENRMRSLGACMPGINHAKVAIAQRLGLNTETIGAVRGDVVYGFSKDWGQRIAERY